MGRSAVSRHSYLQVSRAFNWGLFRPKHSAAVGRSAVSRHPYLQVSQAFNWGLFGHDGGPHGGCGDGCGGGSNRGSGDRPKHSAAFGRYVLTFLCHEVHTFQ